MMVKQQIELRGIINKRVLNAMRSVDRSLYVNPGDDLYAYDDRPLFIGAGQTISQPYMVAIMTDVLDTKDENSVLEIGTGSGYQTAILAEMSRKVYTVERIKSLLESARKRLKKLNYTNIEFKTGDGTLGWQEHAPYDRIIVTAAAPDIPTVLFEQLAIGGRLVIPVGGKFLQELKLVLKDKHGQQKILKHGGCVFVPLIGKHGWKGD